MKGFRTLRSTIAQNGLFCTAIGLVNSMCSSRKYSRPFGWTILSTLLIAFVGFSLSPLRFDPEIRTKKYHTVAQRWINGISGACLGAALGYSISLVYVLHKKSRPGQFSIRTLFAIVAVISVICLVGLWYRHITSLSYPSKLVQFLFD